MLLALRQITKKFDNGFAALNEVNFHLNPGEFVFLAGASGAGKSTLLKLIYGADLPSSGDIFFSGQTLQKKTSYHALRKNCGIIFQDYRLIPEFSVYDNVAICLRLDGVKDRSIKDIVIPFLQELGLENKIKSVPSQLSGGEQQRVAIARALIRKPKLLLADEPTGNLDPKRSRQIFDMLLEANTCGVAVLVATHDVAAIEALNLRTVVLDQGRIVGDYTRSQRIY